MKAYLAHSSEDKQYVEIVAKRLGRMHSEYDVKSFPPGFELPPNKKWYNYVRI